MQGYITLVFNTFTQCPKQGIVDKSSIFHVTEQLWWMPLGHLYWSNKWV